MTIEFSVDHDHTYAGEVGIEQLIGWITFSVSTYPGDFRVREQGAGAPRVINLPSRRGWLAVDGHLYKDQTLEQPCRLVANDPAFNLEHLTYRADFDLETILGDPVAVPHCYFPAPSTDTTLQLTKVMASPSQPVMEVRTKGYIEDIIDVSGVGGELVTAPSIAAAHLSLDIGTGIYDPVNVKMYGAVGNGVHDDTAGIEAAWAVAQSIYFPPGAYVYNGTGLTLPSGKYMVKATGSGDQTGGSIITLGSSSYLFNIATQVYGSSVSNLDIRGGKGAFKHTFTGVNVGDRHTWANVSFRDYTECAWASDASDMPMVNFINCYFQGANTTGTIGVALSGLSDQSSFINCDFTKNRVHVKLRQGGNNAHFVNCGFIQFSAVNSSGPRSSVWVVPNSVAPAYQNAGTGFVIRDCKFGNEFLADGDYRILYADEGSGATNGVKMPDLGADSTGFITGHNIESNSFNHSGYSHITNPLIYSTTPNIQDLAVANNQIVGGLPSYVIEFRTPSVVPSPNLSQNTFGPFHGSDIATNLSFLRMSNAVGVGYRVDHNGNFQEAASVRPISGGTSVNYAALSTAAITSYSLSNITRANTTDAYGGSDAATLTFTAANPACYTALPAMTPGLPVWIEFDVKNPNDGHQLSQFQVFVVETTGGYDHFRRMVEVPAVSAGWVTYAFHFTPVTAGTSCYLMFGDQMGTAFTNSTVTVGRPRIYHSTERVLGGKRPTITGDRTTGTGVTSLLSSLAAQGLITDSTTAGTAVVLSGGALGTPSSGTLTNCTGLPPGAGLVKSTSDAVGFGSIDLGHASDTTIARSSAGVITVEGVVVDTISAANTLTNKRITKRIGTAASSATPSIDCGLYDQYNITALAAAITAVTITGTPTDGQELIVRIKDDATARAIAWGASFVGTLLSTTVVGKTHHQRLVYDAAATKWAGVYADTAGY